MIRRNIDGKVTLSDEKLVALVKKAYKRTAKICSRGVLQSGPLSAVNDSYASASGAMREAFGTDVFDSLGFSQSWQSGFIEGFEWKYFPHEPVFPWWPDGKDSDFLTGFEKGKMVAVAVFSWPESPKVGDKPQK